MPITLRFSVFILAPPEISPPFSVASSLKNEMPALWRSGCAYSLPRMMAPGAADLLDMTTRRVSSGSITLMRWTSIDSKFAGLREFRAGLLRPEAGKQKHRHKSRGLSGIECKESYVAKNLHINPPGCMIEKSALSGKRGTDVLGFAASGICGFIFSLRSLR